MAGRRLRAGVGGAVAIGVVAWARRAVAPGLPLLASSPPDRSDGKKTKKDDKKKGRGREGRDSAKKAKKGK